MRRLVGLTVLFCTGTFISLFAQVDTSFIYNTSMPYGTLDLRLAKSSTQYYYLQENSTFSFRESSPGVKTNTYRDMTSWDSSPYKQGHLREKTETSDFFIMNYRVLFPVNYNPSYEPGYPIIMMLHGAGESGNCWNDDCYWATTGYNPNTNNPPAPTDVDHQLLNNDRNLLHGGAQHLTAVNLAGSKLPNDPALPARAFPGFVLFPQSLNGWMQPQKVEEAIKLLRLFIKKYNIDENRVYIHGLSNGGGGVNQALKRAPWLFACGLGMSAVTDGGIASANMFEEVGKLPLWYFQGGQDGNPTPSRTYNFIKRLRNAGGVVRYSLYPSLGHGTWNTAYNEPDFFLWIVAKKKTNPHVFYGNSVICNTTGAGSKLGFSRGFLAYQWEKDGVIIQGANAAEYIATTPGIYRGRFSRKSTNPSDSEWEPWSDPITVTDIDVAKPSIVVTGSTHLRGPGLASNEANNKIILSSSVDAELYNWYKNGQPVNFPVTDIDDTLKTATFVSTTSSGNGAYTLVVKNSNCPSVPSDPVNVFFGNSAPVNIAINAAATNLTATATSSTIFLTWNDAVPNETGYEVWRRKNGTSDFVFAGRTTKDAVSFLDVNLEPSTTYQYKVRAINNIGRSAYIPSDNLATNLEITTKADFSQPSPPQDLIVVSNTISSIHLSWKPARDNAGIKEYVIRYGTNEAIVPASKTTHHLTGLSGNTTYAITVLARDFSGRLSQPSNQVLGSTYVTTLTYNHSTGVWPELDDPILLSTFANPEFTGTVNNFTLTPRTQEDYFNFQFKGYLMIPQDGNYFFRTTSDDGSKLFIDGNLVVDNDGKHGSRTIASDTTFLTAGYHTIEVQYFENVGAQNLVVQYKGPGIGDGVTYTTIPESALKSGIYTPPVPLATPINLIATASGMQQVSLSWEYADDEATDFEVYRAINTDGPYQITARSAMLSVIDSINLIPGTTYFYKVKAVSGVSSSALSAATSASTLVDNVSPSVPSNLAMKSKTSTAVAFTWNQSTDNTGIDRYKIFLNGSLIGESQVPFYTASILNGNIYEFTVASVDAAGNVSTPSSPLIIDNTIPGMYFSLPTGNLNDLSTWKKIANGTGPSPTNFTENGQTFVIANRTATSLTTPWAVSGSNSKVVVPSGVTLDVQNACHCTIELQENATLRLNSSHVPNLTNISELSTVIFESTNTVPKNVYGNLLLKGSGVKNLMGDTIVVRGDMTVDNNVNLVSTPITVLKIHKNIDFGNGSVAHTAHLLFTDNALHNLQTSSDLNIFKITANKGSNVNLAAPDAIKLTLGNESGGGLALLTDSKFDAKNSTIQIAGNGTINSAANETGKLALNSNNLIVASSSSSDSHIYVDDDQRILSYLEVSLNSSKLYVHDTLAVSHGLKLKKGELNTGNKIILKSSADTSAIIYPLDAGAKIVGSLTVEKHLNTGNAWADLSNPVGGVKVSDWQKAFPVTGNFSGASSGANLPNTPSLFSFNPIGNSFEPYPSAGSTNASILETGKGYSALMHLLNDTTTTTLKVTGVPHQGAISIPASGLKKGWNLVGNPYASPVVWQKEGWARTNLSNVIAIRDSKNINGNIISKYQYYDPSLHGGVISSGAAFWVDALDATASLVIEETAKAPSANSVTTKYLQVNLTSRDSDDEVYIVFDDNGTIGYDPLLDGRKLKNEGLFNLSLLTNTIDLSINHINTSSCNDVLKLNIQDAGPGEYTFNFVNNESIEQGDEVVLVDHFLNKEHDIQNGKYKFSITGDTRSARAERFSLVFKRHIANLESVIAATSACTGQNAQVTIQNTSSGFEYFAIDRTGTIVSNTVTAAPSTTSLEILNKHMSIGPNTFHVMVRYPGCSADTLLNTASVLYLDELKVEIEPEVQLCNTTNTILTANAPAGVSFNWYNSDKQLIKTTNENTLTIQDIRKDTSVYVSIKNGNSCTSDSVKINILADKVGNPSMLLRNDTLFVSGSGSLQWYFNNNLFEPSSQFFHVPIDTGKYHVTLTTNTGCEKTSNTYRYNGKSTNPITASEPAVSSGFDIQIFPNPVSGQKMYCQIASKYANEVLIALYTIQGEEVQNMKIIGNTNTLVELESEKPLSPGTYVLKAKQRDLILYKKVIINP
jgi:hypothetical protein